tara:strand:- start:3072 stop:4787 length:1716 start_codon:yes stop_codon:yes gene_type:complete
MINFTKYIFLYLVFVIGPSFNYINAQSYIGALNDSIKKYKAAEYQKALDFGFLALDFFKDEDEMSLEFVNTNYYLGETYFYLEEYKTSFEYLSQTLELYDLLKPNQRRNKDVVKPPWVLIIMGNVFYQKKDYDNAERFYNEALENFKLFDANYNDEKFNGINTSLLNLSLVKRDQGDLELAKELLDKLFKRVNNFKPTPSDLVRVYTSYMELYMFSGNKNLVVENFNKIKIIYESSLSITNLELESPLVFAIANRRYADFLESNGQVEESLEYLLFARNLVEDIPNEIPKVNFEISKTYFLLGMNDKAKNLIQKNLNYERINATQRLNNFKLLEEIYLSEQSTENLLKVKDSIIYYNEQPIIEQQEKEFNTLENLILISEKQDDLNKSQLRTDRIILISLISLSALILILLSLKFNFDLQKEKNTRLSLEKDLISEELKQKKRELFSKVNFISQRNDYLSKISDQIGQDLPESKKLKRQIKNITNSEKTYSEFDKMFSQVYPKFYKRLNAVAKLTQTDIRLASYIKMNHTNNEIARISGISFRTVESQRYRLSKKLNLVNGQDLNSFIQNL